MIFHRNDLDLVLVPSGLLIMFTYHLFFLYRYRRHPETTVMGIENVDKRAWVEGIINKLTIDKRTFATNVISSSVTAATFLASISLTLSSLLGAWIANSAMNNMFQRLGGLGDMDPSTTAIKYMSLLACFILAFGFFLQSARHFVHANYLITTQGDNSSEYVKVILIKGGECLSVGLRAIYFALALLLWFFGPVPMFAASAILVLILYHHDIHSIPLASVHRLKARSGVR